MSSYNPQEIEPRWQKWWDDNQTFRTSEDRSRPKYYVLDMFPYPSGSGLHVGHPSGYTATDIIARYKRMRGFNVLHPMGWDAFGLPAERAAVREGEHPAKLTAENIANFKRQIRNLGFSYDWDREINTTDPSYYRWTQWIFLLLHKRGLAYRAEVAVNWCPAQGTVLANEEVVDGRYVETGDLVERRQMMQWQLRIPHYAERLIEDLDELDWPEPIKEMQRNWIGKSVGVQASFPLASGDGEIEIFTTRPDTMFGATYMVLAPEHPLVTQITTDAQRAKVEAYQAAAAQKTDLQRTDLAKDKSGVFTGAYAINPASKQEIPIYIAEYVLASYGTGAIMAVPAHDDRDYEFAKAHDISILEVISGGDISEGPWVEPGEVVNSGFISGMDSEAAKEEMISWLEKEGIGERRTNYRLRDWLFSRQRYWGEPFPVLIDDNDEVTLLPEDALPVELPHLDDFRPTTDGQPPLARATSWRQVKDEETGKTRWRETNTMPQWAGSCWYYLRFIDPHNDEAFVDPEKEKYWMPVDLYVGGAEHAVLHLLYARFWHKVLYDAGLVSTKEPFQKLFNQGMILAHSYRDADGKYYAPEACEQSEETGDWLTKDDDIVVARQVEKMSKSKYNVVNPDDVVATYGADSLRLYEMYLGPLEQSKPWQDDGVRGMSRFLSRAWRVLRSSENSEAIVDREATRKEERSAHLTTKRVTDGIENIRMNTSIAALIEWLHELTKAKTIPQAHAERFALLLSPFAPHLAEEIWQGLGNEPSTSHQPWPEFDETKLAEDSVEVPVQVNGRVRATIQLSPDADEATASAAAHGDPKVQQHLAGLEVKKYIWIKGRMLNIIAK